MLPQWSSCTKQLIPHQLRPQCLSGSSSPAADLIVHCENRLSLGAALYVAMEAPTASRYAGTHADAHLSRPAPMSKSTAAATLRESRSWGGDNSRQSGLIFIKLLLSQECIQNATSAPVIQKKRSNKGIEGLNGKYTSRNVFPPVRNLHWLKIKCL